MWRREREGKSLQRESEHPEKENKIKINTYLQHRVFLSLRWGLVWNINGYSAAQMAVWGTKGSINKVGEAESYTTDKRSRKRQMMEINNGMRVAVAPEIGNKITIQNRKPWHTGGLTKSEIESQREKVGQIERWGKMSFHPVRWEIWEGLWDKWRSRAAGVEGKTGKPESTTDQNWYEKVVDLLVLQRWGASVLRHTHR